MDFTLIREHPWWTATIIGGGAIVLYLIFRKSNTSTDAQGTTLVYGSTSSTATDQATLQQQQLNAQLAALGIQGQTQITLAQLGLQGTALTTAAQQDVTNTQTAAELQLGLGSQAASVAQSQIDAAVQIAWIDALSRAYGGNTTPSPTPAATVPANTTPTSPYAAPTTVVYRNTITQPTNVQTPVAGGAVIAGGTPLVPLPNYETCNPLDSACVARNQTLSNNYGTDVKQAQATNNYNQCLVNANNATPDQRASVLAACQGQFSAQIG